MILEVEKKSIGKLSALPVSNRFFLLREEVLPGHDLGFEVLEFGDEERHHPRNTYTDKIRHPKKVRLMLRDGKKILVPCHDCSEIRKAMHDLLTLLLR